VNGLCGKILRIPNLHQCGQTLGTKWGIRTCSTGGKHRVSVGLGPKHSFGMGEILGTHLEFLSITSWVFDSWGKYNLRGKTRGSKVFGTGQEKPQDFLRIRSGQSMFGTHWGHTEHFFWGLQGGNSSKRELWGTGGFKVKGKVHTNIKEAGTPPEEICPISLCWIGGINELWKYHRGLRRFCETRNDDIYEGGTHNHLHKQKPSGEQNYKGTLPLFFSSSLPVD